MLPSEILAKYRSEVLEIMQRYEPQGISNLRIFGSVARGEDRPDSDIDFLVDAGRISLFTLGGLQAELEELLQVPVDLVISDGIKEGAREQIENGAVKV